MTKLKLAVVGSVAAAAMAAPLLIQHQSLSRLRDENQLLQQQQNQVAQLSAENERLSNLVAQTTRAQTFSEDQLRELLKLRAEVGLLRQQSKELAQLQQENLQLRAQQAAVPQLAPPQFQRVLTGADVVARNDCINHLRQIDGAIQQYALEYKLSENDTVTAEQILPYLKNSEVELRCPSGGTYTFGPVSNLPLCSIPGHAIPTEPVKNKL